MLSEEKVLYTSVSEMVILIKWLSTEGSKVSASDGRVVEVVEKTEWKN